MLEDKGIHRAVATRPLASRTASKLPARSTWDIIQPPKMSPVWLASEGIGMTRNVGSLPSGKLIVSVFIVFLCPLLNDRHTSGRFRR